MEAVNSSCAVCKEPSSLKCTGCQLIAYCNRDHQKAHWKVHKRACKPYKIANNPQLGRHIIATRDIKNGDIIISELPFIIGPKTNMTEVFNKIGPCVGCYRPVDIEQGARCPRCDWPTCSSQCPGLKDPNHHGTECILLRLGAGPELTKLGNRYYRYSALLLLRCLILQRRFVKKWDQLLDMESHIEDRREGTEAYREVESQIGYLNENYLKVMRYMEDESGTTILRHSSSHIMHQIAGILEVNSLDVHLNSGLDLSALYPTICLLEHSCMPNTCHTFDIESEDPQKRFKIFLRAAGDIKKGQHITTMYTHALWGTRNRREHLMESKYFACACARCRDPTEMGTYISALKCLGMEVPETNEIIPCDGGYQLPINPLDMHSDWACRKPGCIVHVKSVDVNKMLSQMNDEVDEILESKPNVSAIEEILKKLSIFLHPNHYLIYRLQHTLVQLYGYQQGYLLHQLSDEQLQKKISTCRQMLDINAKIDPNDCRIQMYTVVILFELQIALTQIAKKNFAIEDSGMKKKAVATFKEVRSILDKCKDVLKYELQMKAGAKINSLVEQASTGLIHYLEVNSIKL